MPNQSMSVAWTPQIRKQELEPVRVKRGPCPAGKELDCDVPVTRAKLPESVPCYRPGARIPCVPRAEFPQEAAAEANRGAGRR